MSDNGTLNFLRVTLRFHGRLIQSVRLSLKTRRARRFRTSVIPVRIRPITNSNVYLSRALIGSNLLTRDELNTSKGNNEPAIITVRRPTNVSTIREGMSLYFQTRVNNKRSSNATSLLTIRRFTFSNIQRTRGNINILGTPINGRVTRVDKAPNTRNLNLVLLTPNATLNLNNVNRQINELTPFNQNFKPRVAQGARFTEAAIVGRVGFGSANNNNRINSVLSVTYTSLTRNNILTGCRHTRTRLTNRLTGRGSMKLVHGDRHMVGRRCVVRTGLFGAARALIGTNRHVNVRVTLYQFLAIIHTNPTIRRHEAQVGRGSSKGHIVPIDRFRRAISRNLVARVRTVGYTRHRRNLLIITRQEPNGQTFNIEDRIHSFRGLYNSFVHTFGRISLCTDLHRKRCNSQLNLVTVHPLSSNRRVVNLQRSNNNELVGHTLSTAPGARLHDFLQHSIGDKRNTTNNLFRNR